MQGYSEMPDPRPLLIGADDMAFDCDLVMDLGESVRDRVLHSSFAADTDSALATMMHSRLAMPEKRWTQGWAPMARVAAPPAAWEVLARWIMRSQRVRPGDSATSRNQARSLVRLASRVQTEITRLSHHPAYKGEAVSGLEPMVLPAYRTPKGCWPTPMTALRADPSAGADDLELGVLEPWCFTVRNREWQCWIWRAVS